MSADAQRVSGVPDLDEIVEAARDQILEGVTTTGAPDPGPDELVERALLEREVWEGYGESFDTFVAPLDVLRLAHDQARELPGYRGIEDPEQEGYCSTCKRVRPIEEFTESDSTCDRCRERYGK